MRIDLMQVTFRQIWDLPRLSALPVGLALLLIAVLLGLLPVQTSLPLAAVTAAVIMALRHPWLVWVALAALIPLAASLRVAGVSPADLLVAAGLLLWAAHAIARRQWIAAPQIPLWPLALYLAALLFASVVATNLGEAASEVIKWAQFAVLLWVVPLATPSRVAPWLIAALLLAAVAQSVLGLYQFIYRIGPEWFTIQDRFMRASGVFRQPNPYAGYLGLSLPIALALSLWSLGRWRQWHRQPPDAALAAALVIASTLIAAGLVASWSRGGWLGAAVGVSVVVVLHSRGTALVASLIALGGGLSASLGALNPAWVPATIRDRLTDLPSYFGAGDILNQPVTDENFAVLERLAHWVAATRMWEGSLWLGVGPGNYNQAYAAVALPLWPQPLGHAHNIYLNVLAESGIVGFVAFVLLWLVLAGWLIRLVRRLPPHNWQRAVAVGSLGVLAHLAVHSLFDNLFVQGIYLHLAFWPAVLAIAAPRESDDPA